MSDLLQRSWDTAGPVPSARFVSPNALLLPLHARPRGCNIKYDCKFTLCDTHSLSPSSRKSRPALGLQGRELQVCCTVAGNISRRGDSSAKVPSIRHHCVGAVLTRHDETARTVHAHVERRTLPVPGRIPPLQRPCAAFDPAVRMHAYGGGHGRWVRRGLHSHGSTPGTGHGERLTGHGIHDRPLTGK